MLFPFAGAVQTPWKNEPGNSTQTLPTPTDTLGMFKVVARQFDSGILCWHFNRQALALGNYASSLIWHVH